MEDNGNSLTHSILDDKGDEEDGEGRNEDRLSDRYEY